MTSKVVSRRLEIRSSSSLGSWVQSAIANFPRKVMEKKKVDVRERKHYIEKVEEKYSNGLFCWAKSSYKVLAFGLKQPFLARTQD